MKSINVLEKFSLFNEKWTPKIIGELNGQQIKLAKLENDFVWHSHEHEDEMFLIFKGTLNMEFRDRTEVLHEGDMIIVPKGVEHFPNVPKGEECWLMLFEPISTKHTGEVIHEKTVKNPDWI